MKEFTIPVTWQVWDKVTVQAETIEQALQYLEDNMEDIPLGTEPEYIDGTHRVLDGHNGQADIATTVKYLMDEWDLSGGITGDEIDDEENDTPYVNQYAEMIERHKAERNAFKSIVAIGEEALNEGLERQGWSKDDVRLVHDCGLLGFYVYKDDYNTFTEMLARHKAEYDQNIADDVTGEGFIFEMFNYELYNHEYFVTDNPRPALDSLDINDEDLEENPALMNGLLLAQKRQTEVHQYVDDEEMER